MKKNLIALIVLILTAGIGGGIYAFYLLQTQETEKRNNWEIENLNSTTFRAVHLGRNTGATRANINQLPSEYFEYLRDSNVEWVGISVALHLDGSKDSSVERKYSGVAIPTYKDNELKSLIQRLHKHKFKVLVNIYLEENDMARSEFPMRRLQIGDPNVPTNDSNIKSENWPWDMQHPDHAKFVEDFWKSYTEQAVYFARIAKDESVEVYSVGTETDGLFRTRSGLYWPNDYKSQVQVMVDGVRAEYNGKVTYGMHYSAVEGENFYYKPGSQFLWKDIGFDVIGINAYFPLVTGEAVAPISADHAEKAWNKLLKEDIKTVQLRNPDKQVLFLEFGYVDSVGASVNPSSEDTTQKVFTDNDGNNLDDGEETQANIYKAFFQSLEKNPGIVHGAFLWEVSLAKDGDIDGILKGYRGWDFRRKLAEAAIHETYKKWFEKDKEAMQTQEMPTE